MSTNTPESTTNSVRVLEALRARIEREHAHTDLSGRWFVGEEAEGIPPEPPAFVLLDLDLTMAPQFSTNSTTLVADFEIWTAGTTLHEGMVSALQALDDVSRAIGNRTTGLRRDLEGIATDTRVQGVVLPVSASSLGGYVRGTITVTYLGDGA